VASARGGRGGQRIGRLAGDMPNCGRGGWASARVGGSAPNLVRPGLKAPGYSTTPAEAGFLSRDAGPPTLAETTTSIYEK